MLGKLGPDNVFVKNITMLNLGRKLKSYANLNFVFKVEVFNLTESIKSIF